MDWLINIISAFDTQAFAFIREHIGYLWYYKSNIGKLEVKFRELDARREDIQRRVDTAKRKRAEEEVSEIKNWFEEVKRMKREVERIRDDLASEISTNYFLNIKLHYKLGRDAANHIKTIDDDLRSRNFDIVSHERPPPSTTTSLLYNEDYLIFDSRESHVRKILEALKNEAVHSIGLWGMGGVGKTMLVKDAAKQAKEQSLFGEVVMVTISQNIDLKRIQTEIAECLGFKLEEESLEVRAFKLADRLTTTRNKVLVILDDLWEQLDLSKVGIRLPEMATTCKLVITTRNKYVCERMSCQEIVELNKLSDEESWSLFKRRAGDAVESSTIRELAWNVMRECAGLPMALVVLGTALKGKRPVIWEVVLMQLKRVKTVDLEGVSKKLFHSIKVSFDFLESKAAKSCFLHCCLYPEDTNIPKDELMHMMVGGGLLADVETLNEAQSRVDLLLDYLKACGLLLQGWHEDFVRMHDVVRDVAIQIGDAADHAFYVRAGQGLTEWPRTTESEMRRLSLMNTDIKDLPPDPMQYPKLEMLILRLNKRLSSIPEMFFQHMGSLMVLDLSQTGIKSLPESFSCLINLRALNLEYCHYLKDISHIKGLKKLEILILNNAQVSIAPEGLEWAQNLRCVHLYTGGSPSLTYYFSNELPRFPRLEQLFLGEFVGSFQELISSRHLTHVFIMDGLDFDDSFLSQEELVSLDSWADRLLEFGLSFLQGEACHLPLTIHRRSLKLRGTKKPLAVWVKKLLEKTTALKLVQFQETELISMNSDIPPLVFSSLKCLEVVNWPKLTKLLGDELSLHEEIPLSQLHELVMDNCPRLTKLIPSRLCQRNLRELWRLKVMNCPMMLELFPCDQGAHDIIELLPTLKDLYLIGLRSLQNALQPFQCLPNLKDLYICDCGVRYVVSSEMETVAILADPFPALENLDIRYCPEMIGMIFPRPSSSQTRCYFQVLRELRIWSCPRLTHLLSCKQAISMQHLSELDIVDCDALEAVVISTENIVEASASTSTHVVDSESYNSPFPNLKELFLNNLPQLTAFCHPTALPIDWLHLTHSGIIECPKLQHPLFGPRTPAHELVKDTSEEEEGETDDAAMLDLIDDESEGEEGETDDAEGEEEETDNAEEE
ncbi:probable disease resistance protein At4g27220 [Dioscorea cayenensis subsp. rotundata]|uniref:Probable disease resistance protein At4g27220 n=1 Tax=Dioscorea cayennensis subsp. rotundata TaxID=55577 RepID=A0AB40CQN8_DIOCR|nr:probable disease resistance protein At4g27220 [Dioscorea cayenensis subsp. rotundata]